MLLLQFFYSYTGCGGKFLQWHQTIYFHNVKLINPPVTRSLKSELFWIQSDHSCCNIAGNIASRLPRKMRIGGPVILNSASRPNAPAQSEIGRASCRERMSITM